MKKFLKWFFIIITTLMLVIAVTPFLLLQFGSESTKTTTQMLLSALIGYGIETPAADVVQQRFLVPEGFSINVYAKNLKQIRFMQTTSSGDLLVTRPRTGEILLLASDNNNDGQADDRRILLSGLDRPHGIDLNDEWLYIAEATTVKRVRFNQRSGTVVGQPETIVEGLTVNGNHWTKTIRIGPDGWIYLAMGSTCNVCEEEDPRRAAIIRFKPDGSEQSIYATGLRNSVGFDWAPWDQSLYATDNGRDLLGDDFPPCELNKIVEGGFYGWPYINGFAELDPDMGNGRDDLLEKAISPTHGFKPHNAPLGIRFLKHTRIDDFDRTAIVALHGSWNRSIRDGYKVVSLHWLDDGSIEERDFVTGFKVGDNDVIGRPVDVAEDLLGNIYISDDFSGTIYRVNDGSQPAVVNSNSINDAMKNSSESLLIKTNPLDGLDASTIAQLSKKGSEFYRLYACANCHGNKNNSRVKPGRVMRPLVNLSERYTVDSLQDFFLSPTPPMPVFPLNNEQRKAVAVYLLNPIP